MKKLTTRQYELEVARILDAMRSEARPFEDDSDIARETRIEDCRKDILLFGETYFPHYCKKPCGEFHQDLVSYFDMPGEMGFFAGPRESGKTTWDALIAPVYFIVYALKHFIIIVSENESLAADYNYFVMLELENNERLRADFGDLVGDRVWTKENFVTKNNIRVWCRGYQQPMKGRRWLQYRPDYIVCIDLESLQTTRNPDTVALMKSKLSGEFYGSMAEDGTFLMEGQIIRKNCVLGQFCAEKNDEGEPKYRSSVWGALYDDDTRSYWPEGWTVEQLLKKKYNMGVVEWNRWMQNRPSDEEGAFKEEWIKYYHPDEIKGRRLITVTAGDPSMTSKATSDYKAIITLSMDEDGIAYVRDAFIKRVTPYTMVAAAYSRYEEYQPIHVGFEDNALKDFLWIPFDEYAKSKGYHLPLRPITNTMNKEDRILQLSPVIERGKIRFLKGHSDQAKLIEQLIFFGQPAIKKDGADALRMAWGLVQQVGDLVMVVDAEEEDEYARF